MTRKRGKQEKGENKNIEMPSRALIEARPCVEIVVSARYAPSATSKGRGRTTHQFFQSKSLDNGFFFLFFFF